MSYRIVTNGLKYRSEWLRTRRFLWLTWQKWMPFYRSVLAGNAVVADYDTLDDARDVLDTHIKQDEADKAGWKVLGQYAGLGARIKCATKDTIMAELKREFDLAGRQLKHAPADLVSKYQARADELARAIADVEAHA